MFNKKEKDSELLNRDIELSSTISTIYSIIIQWWKIERENANNGNDIERRFIDSIANFDFSYFRVKPEEEIELTLNELFEATEYNFVPNRMRLLASQIELRFGTGVVRHLTDRIRNILITLYKIDPKRVDSILGRYPALWVVHCAQGSALQIV